MRKIKIGRENSRMLLKVTALTLLITSVVIAFAVFMNYNSRKALREASLYLEDAAKNKASDVEDMLYEGERYAEMMSVIKKDSGISPKSFFSYVAVVDREGNVKLSGDKKKDVSEEEFFIEGMKGKSGFSAVTRRENGSSGIIFYSPLDMDNAGEGVLLGYLERGRIERSISDSVFGISIDTFLFTEEGDIVASSRRNGDYGKADDIYELLGDEKIISKNKEYKVENAVAEGSCCNLIYRDKDGKSPIRIEPAGNSGFYIMQIFPSAVVNAAADEDNNAGLIFEIVFIVIGLIFLGMMIVINYRRRKFLMQQNRELGYIVKGMVKLFDKFVVVNLKNNTYKFLMDGGSEAIPQTGKYEELAEYISEGISKDDRVRISSMLKKENIQSSMRSGSPDLICEYRTAHGNGKWENLNIICLERENEIPVRVLLARQDVTEVKEEEERYRQALREAFALTEKANNAKSRFLSQISHDIRTPMNGITGMTTVAMMHIDDREKVKDCLNKISVSGEHLLGIINKVLDMSEIEKGGMGITEEAFELKELMNSLMAIFSLQAEEKKQDLKIDTDIVNGSVIGDPVRLQQVFVNILGNAIKFTPSGGKIHISVCEKAARVKGMGYYEFVFEDNGIGMSEEFTKKIFEPFARENSRGAGAAEGSGLGMSIAGSIIQTMNGSLQVESRIGEGSRFTVGIDLKLQGENRTGCDGGDGYENEEQSDAENSVKSLRENNFTGMRVLIAEDNELNMDIAAELFGMIGIDADKAVNGKEAVDRIRAGGEGKYDMVFMDIQMPVMDGYEATEEIRKTEGKYFSVIPIIAMSANTFTEDVEKAKNAGMNDYISKPVEVDKLIKAIETWCGV